MHAQIKLNKNIERNLECVWNQVCKHCGWTGEDKKKYQKRECIHERMLEIHSRKKTIINIHLTNKDQMFYISVLTFDSFINSIPEGEKKTETKNLQQNAAGNY